MEFHVNHPVLYILVAFLVAVVLGQSVYFLVKALRRSRQIGMDQSKIKKPSKPPQCLPLHRRCPLSSVSSR